MKGVWGFLLAICFILSAVFISGCSNSNVKASNSPTVSPQGTFDIYIKALNEKDAETIYNLLMDGTKKKTIRADFYNNFDFSKTERGQYIVYDHFDYYQDGLSATVTADVTLKESHYGNDIYSNDRMCLLMYWENGKWKIII